MRGADAIMKGMAMTSNSVPFWQQKPGRYYEQGIVALFLALPPVGLVLFMFFAWRDEPGRFWSTVELIAALAFAIGLHIKFVRPAFTKYPFVQKFGELNARIAALKTRFGKNYKSSLVSAIYVRRILRASYRIIWAIFVFWIAYRMYQIHGSQFWWQVLKYAMAGFGITFGYHRLAHKAFQAPKWLQYVAYFCGSTANQGIIGEWYRKHMKHHSFSETSCDVHSPVVLEESRRGIAMAWFTTFLNSFVFWALKEPSYRRRKGMSVEEWQKELWDNRPRAENFLYRPEDKDKWGDSVFEANGKTIVVTTQDKLDKEWKRYCERLVEIDNDTVMTQMSNPLLYFAILVGVDFVIPYYLGGVSPLASLASICIMSWATFSVNSVSHLWGERPFDTQDSAHNNAVVEILALGEGGHNTHHHKAGYAVHGAYSWMFDPTGWLVRILEKLKVLKNVNYASRAELLLEWRHWQQRLRQEKARA